MNKILLVVAFLFVAGIIVGSNAHAHHIIKEIDVSKRPTKMSLVGDTLFVPSFGYPHVNIIDTKTNENLGFITTSGSGIMAVEAVPDKNKIYVSEFASGKIDTYTLSTKLPLGSIELPQSKLTLWHSPREETQAYLHFLTGGWSLDYNPNNELLYVADYIGNRIYVIDSRTDKIVEVIPVSRHPFTVKVDPITNTVLVASLAGNEVSFITQTSTPHSREPVHEVSKTVKTGIGPWGIDIDPQEHRAYVTNRGSYHITVIDILNQQVIGNIPIGDRAQAISVDTSEHMIYASYLSENKIVKIDGKTNEIVLTIDSGAAAWDLVVHPQTHNLYASMKGEDKVFVMGPKSIAATIPVITLQTPISYVGDLNVHGQDVRVTSATVDIESKILTLQTHTEDGGMLTIGIPRILLDAQETTGQDIPFMVYAQENLIDHKSVGSDESTRAISIQVPPNTEALSISGTSVIPEFGPITALILASGIVGIIAMLRTSKLLRI